VNEHWVSDKPFNPYAKDELTDKQKKYFLASQWTLVWWKFKKHKVAMFSAFFLIAIYLVAFCAEFFAPYALENRHTKKI
jgi:peptide/nickel transport system permease protein